MRSASSRTTCSPARTASSGPSSVTTFPRSQTRQSRWPSSALSTASSEPASSRAASFSTSICLRTQLLLDQGRHPLAVGAPANGRHHRAHHLAHVRGGGRTGLLDLLGHDPGELLVGELGGQVAADQRGLGLLLVGELPPPAGAELLGGVEAALALAPQDRDLVVAALLGRLLQLRENEPQRSHALALAGLHGLFHIRSDLIGNRHFVVSMIGGAAVYSSGYSSAAASRGDPPPSTGTASCSEVRRSAGGTSPGVPPALCASSSPPPPSAGGWPSCASSE